MIQDQERRFIPLESLNASYGTSLTRFSIYSYIIIFFFTFILILRWRWSPTFIDIYYHLLTVLNFQKCGGFSTISFWEYAPFGRPHLYPPLLHLLMLATYKLSGNILNVARIFELLSFPLVLWVIFFSIRNIFNLRLAFWSVLLSSSMYSFYLSCVDFLAASLSLCLGLLVFVSLERKRGIAAISFLTLCLYAHTSISYFFFLALIIYALFRRERWRLVLGVSLISLVLYAPLLIHQLRFLSFVDLNRVQENFPFELNIIVYFLAVIGVFLAVKRKGVSFLPLSLCLAVLPFLTLRYRFLSGQGMIGIIILAALSLDFFYDKFHAWVLARGRRYSPLMYILFVFSILFFISPAITIGGEEVNFHLLGSTYINIFPSQDIRERTNEISIYLPKTFAPVLDVVNTQTEPDDLIASNHEYLAGFISVFSGRATTSAMLPEIKPFRETNPFKYAKLIIWLKNPQRPQAQPRGLIESLGLFKVAETAVFFIYKNPKAHLFRIHCKRVLPIAFCFGLIFLFSAAAGFDLCRKE